MTIIIGKENLFTAITALSNVVWDCGEYISC
jgi:hypothetical protein